MTVDLNNVLVIALDFVWHPQFEIVLSNNELKTWVQELISYILDSDLFGSSESYLKIYMK